MRQGAWFGATVGRSNSMPPRALPGAALTAGSAGHAWVLPAAARPLGTSSGAPFANDRLSIFTDDAAVPPCGSTGRNYECDSRAAARRQARCRIDAADRRVGRRRVHTLVLRRQFGLQHLSFFVADHARRRHRHRGVRRRPEPARSAGPSHPRCGLPQHRTGIGRSDRQRRGARPARLQRLCAIDVEPRFGGARARQGYRRPAPAADAAAAEEAV